MRDEIEKYIEPGKRNIILIYVLYLIDIVFMYYLFSVVAACFCIYNYNYPNIIWQSHYRFALKSLGKGILGLTLIWMIGILFMKVLNNSMIICPIFISIFSVIISIWFIVRGIIAIQFLLEDRAHPNPDTFWIK